MSEEEKPEFDYEVLKERIAKAKTNPMYGLTKDDVQYIADEWLKSYKDLKKTNRRSITENHNFREFVNMISKYPHTKTRVGYMLYVNNCIVSVLGGEGAFCDELTYEVAILSKNNEFITNLFENQPENLQMSLQYQDLNDLAKILAWCEEYQG